MMGFSVDYVLRTAQPTKKRHEGSKVYPVKIRVIINRKARYFGTGIYLTNDQFETIKNGTPKKKDLKDARKELVDMDSEATKILEALERPNFEDFTRLFTSKGKGGNVMKYYNDYIQDLKDADRHGTASSYECSKISINNKKQIETIAFKDITVKWLEDYERKMLAENKSISTVGIYLRPLRALYRKAIKDGVVPEKYYPFGSVKNGLYEIPSGKNYKRPLMPEELRKLEAYRGTNEKYRDFFLLSFYLSGLNFYDLLTIKKRQLSGNAITLIRHKTANTTRKEQRAIKMIIGKKARSIIDKHQVETGEYLFGIIGANDNQFEIKRKVKNFTRNTNQALKKIAKDLEINQNISTIFARHSAASIAISKKIDIATISEALGHSDIKITSNYISSLGEKAKQDLSDAYESI